MPVVDEILKLRKILWDKAGEKEKGDRKAEEERERRDGEVKWEDSRHSVVLNPSQLEFLDGLLRLRVK
jgi:hypothetical protein